VSAPPCPSVRFGGLDIAYDERVLEPRAWTLAQSEWAAELAADAPDGPMLELCSGAGQIGLAAAGVTGRPLVQVDASSVACDFARLNARSAGIADRVEVRCGDLDLVVGVDETFPIIIADPPYLPSDLVERHPDDPTLAVDGGADGLSVIRTCLSVIDRALADDGAALIQVLGQDQAAALDDELPAGLRTAGLRTHDAERAVVLITRTAPSRDRSN
jgi:release factor glutamine methyltransferase